MSQIVAAPMAIALVAAVLTLLARGSRPVQQGISLLGMAAYTVAVGLLVARVFPAERLTYQVGDWPAPFGITLVADPLSIFMLGLTVMVAVPALVFSVRSVSEYGQRLSYHPLFYLLLLGVSGSFLTGDVFNLFVWFEVMLMASYALVAFEGTPAATRAAFYYLILNLLGSAIMLLAVGGLYATTGTLNMADMTRRLAHPEVWQVTPAPVLGLAGLFLAVFALKAGIAPFHFWVPEAYRAAPAPISAILSGVTKKVGIYGIIRLYFIVFAPTQLTLGFGLPGDTLAFIGPILLLGAAASIIVGGVAAVGRDDLDGVLAYSSVSQVGFIVLPLAIGAMVPSVRPLAVTAALIYALNHALAKGLLFLLSGAIMDTFGTDHLDELGGLSKTSPLLGAGFLIGAFSLIGIPPLAGFFGKLLVFDTAVRAEQAVSLGLALIGAILTIAYMTRAWNRGFWGERTPAMTSTAIDRIQLSIVAVLASLVLILGIGFDPIFRAAEDAAMAALKPEAYVDAVLGGEAWDARPGGDRT